jgi:hypothetical protein
LENKLQQKKYYTVGEQNTIVKYYTVGEQNTIEKYYTVGEQITTEKILHCWRTK